MKVYFKCSHETKGEYKHETVDPHKLVLSERQTSSLLWENLINDVTYSSPNKEELFKNPCHTTTCSIDASAVNVHSFNVRVSLNALHQHHITDKFTVADSRQKSVGNCLDNQLIVSHFSLWIKFHLFGFCPVGQTAEASSAPTLTD